MEFRLLGVLEVLDAGLPVPLGGPKQRSVLAMLLLDANRAVSTDRLVEGLWSEDPPQRAAATLQVYVSNLRKALEPGRNTGAEPSVVVHQRPGYALAVDRADIDLFRFEHMVEVGRSLVADGAIAAASVVFHEALALWRETPLADLADEPFARFEIPRLEEGRLGVTEDRIDADLALGRDVELLPELERLVARNPYRERFHAQLMVALYRAGRQAEALGAYQAARVLLVEELGLEPSRNLRELEAAILVHDPALVSSIPAGITPASVERALTAVTGRGADPAGVHDVVEDGRASARRAEEALRRAVERERAHGLTASLEVAGHAQRELIRSRHALADRVLDRRRRSTPGPAPDGRDLIDERRRGEDRDVCPYKGLLRFEIEDAPWYFGRERLVAELLAAVASARCTGIVGSSGSGKSSLTRAGLLAALRADALPGSAHWPTLLLTPGTDPVLELADALAPAHRGRPSERLRDRLLEEPDSVVTMARRALDGRDDDTPLVLVVDQLEEVFTACRDTSLRARFFDVLVHGASAPDSPMRIVAAIRGDYYGRCAEHPEFAELLGRSNLLVGLMRPDEVQHAIEGPARAVGLAIEDGLVDCVFDDVGTEPGLLPLLETALLATWARRDRDTLTIEGYLASGGVRGAVAHLADDAFRDMTPSEQELARGMLLRLAEPGVGNDDVRRRAPLDELVVDDESGAVLAKLVERRLVVTGDASAEVAHEALLREWPRLRTWLEEDREGRRLHRALTQSAQEWSNHDDDPDLLFRGSRLDAVLDVADSLPAALTPIECDFIAASRQRQEHELGEARRTARRFRRFTFALASLLVVALAAGIIALQQGSQAQESETRAQFQSRLRLGSQLATQSSALPASQFDRRLLLAAEAHRRAPGSETDGALLGALAAAPPPPLRSVRFATPANFAGISRDGALVAAPDSRGVVRIFDTATASETRRFHVPFGGTVMVALFSTDRRWLAVGSIEGAVTVWNVTTGRKVAGPLYGASGAAFGVFDPTDKRRLFVAAPDGAITVWDLSRPGRPVGTRLASGAAVTDDQALALLYVSANGDRVIVGSSAAPTDAPSIVFDAHSGEEVARFVGTPGALSADGRLAALSRRSSTTSTGLETVVVDVESGEVVSAPMPSVSLPAAVMSFDRSASRLAVRDDADQGRVHVFGWRTGVEVADPVDFPGQTLPQFLDDDDLSVRNASGAEIVDLADVAGDTEGSGVAHISHRVAVHAGSDVVFAPDGRVVGTTPGAASVVLADPNGGIESELAVPERVAGGDFVASPDQRTLLVRRDDVVELVDRRSGRSLRSFERSGEGGVDVTWSPDSSSVLLVYDDAEVFVWSRTGSDDPLRLRLPGEVGARLDQFHRRVEVAWRPDSREVLVAVRAGGGAYTYDPRTGRVRSFVGSGPRQFGGGIAYTPDGRTFTLVGHDTESDSTALVVVDDATGRVIAERAIDHVPGALAFYDGAHHLATLSEASGDSTRQTTQLQLWDARSLFPIGDVLLPGIQTRLSVDADGQHLLVRGDGPDATVWDMRPGRWAEEACTQAGRSLTRTEWDRYLPGVPYDPAC